MSKERYFYWCCRCDYFAGNYTGNVVLKQAEEIYSLIKQRGINDEYFDVLIVNYGGTPIFGDSGKCNYRSWDIK